VDFELSDQDAAAQLKQEQLQAGEIIGVSRQYWLGFPDAGNYDYFELRRRIIRYIRLLRPDFLFTCDPWLQYEAHRDHVQTGLAVSEASYLHAMRRLKVEPELDRRYEPYAITGVVFYFSQYPNMEFDITAVHARKHHAIDAYRAQFTPQGMAQLHTDLEAEEQNAMAEASPRYVERLKIVTPAQLHLHTNTWRS
jgi:LmbE family N-acetylglucosaminyl deacetylase